MKIKLTDKRPLLVFAHKGEALAFFTHFKAVPLRLPSLERVNLFESRECLILLTGEGRQEAQDKLVSVLPVLKNISMIINLGVAGALSPDLPVGSMAFIKKIFAEGEAPYQCPDKMAQDQWITADLFTADKRILDSSDARPLAKIAQLVDREAYGLAIAAQNFHLAFIALKVVSDLPWKKNDSDNQQKVQQRAPDWSSLLLQSFTQLF